MLAFAFAIAEFSGVHRHFKRPCALEGISQPTDELISEMTYLDVIILDIINYF